MVDVPRPTGQYAEALIGGIWTDNPESATQDVADAFGMFQPNTEDSVADMRLAAQSWESSTKGRVFDPAGHGMNDKAVYADAGAGYATDRADLAQKVAIEQQSMLTDIAKYYETAVPDIEAAANQGDQDGVQNLITKYRGVMQSRADEADTKMAALQAQHNASVPPPQYISTTATAPSSHGRDLSFSGTGRVSPDSPMSYTTPMSSPMSPVSSASTSPSSSGQAPSPADMALRTPGGADAPQAPAAGTPSPATQGAQPSGGAQSGATPSAQTQAMSSAALAEPKAFDLKPSTVDSGGRTGSFGGPGASMPGAFSSAGAGQPSAPGIRTPAAAPVTPSPPPAAQTPASSAPPTAGQGAGLSGGGSAARPSGVPGGANAVPSSKPAPTIPMAADATRDGAALPVAGKPARPWGLANNVLVPHEDVLTSQGLTILRTLVRQCYDNEHYDVDWTVGILRGGSTSAVRFRVASSRPFSNVPGPGDRAPGRGVLLDPGTTMVRRGKPQPGDDAWLRAVSDGGVSAVLADFGDLKRTEGEEDVELIQVVTTWPSDPSSGVKAQLALHGAHLTRDERSAAIAEEARERELELPSGLRHRLWQLEPGLERVENAEIDEDTARLFTAALAADALQNVFPTDARTVFHDVVEAVRSGREVSHEAAQNLFKLRGLLLIKAQGHALEAPPGDDKEQAIAKAALHAQWWWQYCCGQLAAQLLHFGNPLAKPSVVVANAMYEHASALEDVEKAKMIAEVFGILEPTGQAA